MQLGFLLMSKNVFVYGTEAMAAYGIGNKVNGLITLPSNAIGSATATIVIDVTRLWLFRFVTLWYLEEDADQSGKNAI